MLVRGEIRKIYPIQEGVSQQGNSWKKQEFILSYYETPTERYPDSVVLSIMNDTIDELKLKEGDKIEAIIYHTTREYNGRAYNDVRGSHIKHITNSKPPKSQQTSDNTQNKSDTPVAQGNNEDDDDLPF